MVKFIVSLPGSLKKTECGKSESVWMLNVSSSFVGKMCLTASEPLWLVLISVLTLVIARVLYPVHSGTRSTLLWHPKSCSMRFLLRFRLTVAQIQLEEDLMQRCVKTFSEEGRHSSQHVSNLTRLQNRVRRSSEECFSSLLLLNGFSDPYTWTFLQIWASASSVPVATWSSQPSVSLTLKPEHFAVTCSKTRIQVTLLGGWVFRMWRGSSHSGLYYLKA